MNYTVNQIAEITNAKVIGEGELLIKNIAFDSRIIYSTKNTAFIAINTQKIQAKNILNLRSTEGLMSLFLNIIILSLKT